VSTPIPPLPRNQRTIDEEQLNLLAIFHFVGAGLALLGILFLLGHFAIFHAVFANPKMWENQKPMPGPSPQDFFAIFQWLYVVFGLWFLASAVLNVMSGFYLRARKRRTFSLVVAAVNCLHMPLGTLLGVFTIIALVRESVLQLYEESGG